MTEKDAMNAALRLANALGKEFGACWTKDKAGNLKAKVGCWDIDNEPQYGGVLIAEKDSVGGAEAHPFGHTRRKPREFIESVNFTIEAIDIYKKSKKRRK